MERGFRSQDAQRSSGPLELALARQGEGGSGGLLLIEGHLPSQTGKVHGRKESGLFFFDVGQRFVGFLELDGLLLTLLVEELKVLNNSVTICMLETEQRRVEHGVRLPNQSQSDPLLQGLFNDRKMGLRDLVLLSVNWFRVLDLLRISKHPTLRTRIGLKQSSMPPDEIFHCRPAFRRSVIQCLL